MIKSCEYTNKNGEVKAIWRQVGLMGNKDGRDYMMLDPTVNLAGFKRDGDMLFVSIFEDKPRENAQVEPDIDENSIPF